MASIIDRVLGYSVSIHGELDGWWAEEGVQDGVQEWHTVRHYQRTQVPCFTCSQTGGEDQESRDVSTEDNPQVCLWYARYMPITVCTWHRYACNKKTKKVTNCITCSQL